MENGVLLHVRFKLPFLIACCFIFLLQVASLFYNTRFHQSFSDLQEKTALLFIPLALCCCNYLNSITRKKVNEVFMFALLRLHCCIAL